MTGFRAPAAQIPESGALGIVADLLARADVRINGDRPWDMRIHDESMAERVLAYGSLGLGESYMDGHWHAERLDEFFARVLAAVSTGRWSTPCGSLSTPCDIVFSTCRTYAAPGRWARCITIWATPSTRRCSTGA
jgi:hypothetical protein